MKKTSKLPLGSKGKHCPSCGAEFIGKHCHECGEKRISKKDFRIDKYARLVFNHFTHFGSKLLLSLWLLLWRPGFLSAEFVAGRRVPYMKPLQLFLIINIAFFFAFKGSDVFSPRLHWIYNDYNHMWNRQSIREATDALASSQTLSVEEAMILADEQMERNAKALLYLIIPILALVLFTLFYKQYPYYLCHLIFATHWFASCLLLAGVAGSILQALFHINGAILLSLVLLVIIPGVVIAMRRFYKQLWWLIILKSMIFCFAFACIYLVYREFILNITMWWLT